MTTPTPRLFSLEFFPPRTPEGIEKLRATRRQLAQLKPAFCSVTFGAGGSTREGTLATVVEFRAEGMARRQPPLLHQRPHLRKARILIPPAALMKPRKRDESGNEQQQLGTARGHRTPSMPQRTQGRKSESPARLPF